MFEIMYKFYSDEEDDDNEVEENLRFRPCGLSFLMNISEVNATFKECVCSI